ncbi:MAG: hypothetical protein ABI083_10470 [Lapillicoccus sp.]
MTHLTSTLVHHRGHGARGVLMHWPRLSDGVLREGGPPAVLVVRQISLPHYPHLHLHLQRGPLAILKVALAVALVIAVSTLLVLLIITGFPGVDATDLPHPRPAGY